MFLDVDPRSCFPFTQLKPLSESGVKRLMAHFDVKTHDGDMFGIGVVAQITDTAMVAEISGTMRPFLFDYFTGEDLNS